MSLTCIVATLTGFASLIHFSIGISGLRVSLGIICLIYALYRYQTLPVFKTSLYSGIAVFMVQLMVTALSTHATLSPTTLLSAGLEIIFYVAYGFIFNLTIIHENPKHESPLLLLFILCDFGANAIEYFARFVFLESSIIPVDFQTIICVAVLRSILIWGAIRLTHLESRRLAS